MKRRIYFFISSILQIFLSIYMILGADEYVAELLKVADAYPDDMKERVVSLLENSGGTFVMIVFGIGIIMNIIILFFTFQNTLVKRKKGVIACSIICFFTGDNIFIQLLAITNIVVMAFTKTTNVKAEEAKKDELPKIKKEKVDSKKILLSLTLLAVYFSQFLWSNLVPTEGNIGKIIALSFYMIMIILSIMVFKDLLRNNFKEFIKHFGNYTCFLLRSFAIFLPIYLVSAIMVAILSKNAISANQNIVESLPIFLSAPLAILYAPIVEESLFRGCIRRFIKSDKLFIVISGVAFGLMHTAFSEATVYEAIVHALPYAALGGYLAYLYKKTNNICTNMFFHACFNTFAIIMMILINGV